MGKPGAFISEKRQAHELRAVCERTQDFADLYVDLDLARQQTQASRCMMCGVAFCQWGSGFGRAKPSGCPLHNLIPEWNDLLYRGLMREAAKRLSLTSPLPEFTSRVCPALCEVACNLGRNDEPTTIHDNERAISDWQWAHGGPARFVPAGPDAPRVAVIGSGPSGLACAWELARAGARVCVYERADRPGGLLMYGIPNMKLDKSIVFRRVELMRELGIEFELSCEIADEEATLRILKENSAVVIATGARNPRGLDARGFKTALARGAAVWAVDYLESSTRWVLDGCDKESGPAIWARGKDVVVIGGGDTGNDCMATAVRQGARSVRQLEFMPAPPEVRLASNLWPEWPNLKKTDYGQEEAIALMKGECRSWGVDTLEFCFDETGELCALEVIDLDWSGGAPVRLEESRRRICAQLVCIACGFTGPERGVFEAFGVGVQDRPGGLPLASAPGLHRVQLRDGVSSQVPVYAAGDACRGSSLVVNAIADACACARELVSELGLA